VTIADIDERERSEIAQAMDPSEEDYVGARVGDSQRAARMGAGKVT
jgi:hypothetical protein